MSKECPSLKFIPEGREKDYEGLRLDTMLFPEEIVRRIKGELTFTSKDILLGGYPKTGIYGH